MCARCLPLSSDMKLVAVRPVLMLLLLAWLPGFPSTAHAQGVNPSKFVGALGIRCSDAAGGVLVDEVEPQSAGADLGLRKGDLLVAINDRPIGSGDSLVTLLKAVAPGDAVRVDFVRNQETLSKSIAMPHPRVNMFGAMLQPGAEDRIQVTEVSLNTPAEKAGLQKGDIIISMAGQKPASLADLSAVITKLVANDRSVEPIELVVQRPREPELLKLVIERVPVTRPLPTGPAVVAPVVRGVASEPGTVVLGVAVVEQANHVVVTNMMQRGPAAMAGMLPGDVILAVARKPTNTFEALSAAVSPFKAGDEVAVEVQRAGKPQTFRVAVVKAAPDTRDVVLDPAGAPATVARPAGSVINPPPTATAEVAVPATAAPAVPADVAGLATEVRLLRARVEALEELVKQLAPPREAQPRVPAVRP